MAVCEVKKGVVMMVMIMLVLAQADDITPSTKFEPNKSPITRGFCVAKCAITCDPLRAAVVDYGACLANCSKDCRKMPSNDVYDCVASCTLSKSINVNTDARDVDADVDSCLQACKNK